MVDLDHLAIASSGPGKGNKTAGRRKDGRADRSRNVEPVMHPAGAKDRVAAIAEMRREFRHRRGFRGFARHGEHGFGFGRRPGGHPHPKSLAIAAGKRRLPASRTYSRRAGPKSAKHTPELQ